MAEEIPLINVIDPDTQEVGSLPANQVQEALAQGYEQATPEQVQKFINEKKYGTPGQQLLTGVEGAASAASFGLIPGFGSAEDIRGRREENPVAHGVGQVGGLAATAPLGEFGAAEILGRTGEAAAGLTGLGAEAAAGSAARAASEAGAGLEGINAAKETALKGFNSAEKIGSSAVKGGTEAAFFQTGDEVSKMLTRDPNNPIDSDALETAAMNVGLAGLIGAPLSGSAKALENVFETSKLGRNISQGIEDFKSRLKGHIEIPDPVGKMADELKPFLEMNEEGLDVYGEKGLKAQAIQKLMPNSLSDKMVEQAENLTGKAKALTQTMAENPDLFPRYSSAAFNRDFRVLSESLAEPKAPGEVFDAIQDFKQRLKELLPKKGEIPGPADREFIKSARDLFGSFRAGLEDAEVWGGAAKVQQDINKAFVEYLPALKDFKSKFMTKVGGEPTLDPGKLQTYINQTGKEGQKIKQTMLGNFIEASDKFRDAVNKTAEKIGSDKSFIPPSSLDYTKSTLNQLTSGGRIADALMKSNLGAEALGIGVGATAGHALGSGWIGALIGEHALTPFFKSILPTLIKPMLEKEASAGGFKSAVDFGLSVLKGESLINRASNALFKSGQDVLPSHLIPDLKETKKLDGVLAHYQNNPSQIFDVGGKTLHYYPQHGQPLGQLASKATQYLNSLRPNTDPKLPLDEKQIINPVQKENYNRALQIAQQPLMVLAAVKDGTITPQDIIHLKNLYPALYQRMNVKLMDGMADHLSKGKEIPYRTKMGLSLFLAQPMDSTMTPSAIQATQATNLMGPKPSEQQSHPKHSMNALNKFSLAEATPGQQRERQRLMK